jgi:hypothetical protein
LSESRFSPHALTTAFLTKVLGKAVTKVTSYPIGTGQVGATYRFELDHSDAPTAGPASVVGKFWSDDAISRATGIAQLNYVREVNFYRHYGSAKPLPIPALHFVDQDETTHEFALIMEDFPHHSCGNQLESATLAEAILAMLAGADIHAAYWGDETLDTHTWLNGSKAIAPMNVDGLYNMLWPSFQDRYQGQVSDDVIRAGDAYLDKINNWVARRAGPRCLTHGDFRPDNMLFNQANAQTPLVVVDWQTAGVGNGATDIAYYLGTALTPQSRRDHERSLFDLWVSRLHSNAVRETETKGLWDVYRRDSVAGFLMGVLASMIVARTKRGDEMFLQMCERSAVMIHDHRAFELL